MVLVLSTAASLKEAQKLSNLLLQHRLAACVNLLPSVRSCYRWRGKVTRSREVLMLIKTDRPKLKSIFKFLKLHHSYETPELIALPIQQGEAAYLRWLRENLRPVPA